MYYDYIEELARWDRHGVHLSYFAQFIDECGGRDALANLTTAQVCETFVKPMTAQLQESTCDLLTRKQPRTVGIARVFISHAWKYVFLDVVDAMLYHFRDEPDVVVWFDLFSNNQHKTVEMNFHWLCDTFKSMIKFFGRTVMVLAPWHDPIPLTRAWCLFELYCTADTGSRFEVAMSHKHQERFLEDMATDGQHAMDTMLATINAERSECWKAEDRDRIFDAVRRTVGFAGINAMVFEELRGWVVAVTTVAIRQEADETKALELKTTLARLYDGQGKYDLAEPLFVECLAKRRAVLGDRHPDTLASLHDLANFFKQKGQYDRAEPLYMECLTTTKRVQGDRHPDTLIYLNNLAVLYMSQGQYDRAEPLLVECLATTKQELGDRHPWTLDAMNNLAVLYESQGQYNRAEELYVECLELTKEVLGDRHPSTLDAVHKLAQLWKRQGNHDRAESLYEASLQDRLSGLIFDNLAEEFISSCAEGEYAESMMRLALSRGERPWGRSKILFVGPGRAGKTGTERSMMGYLFEDTASTRGINNDWTCSVNKEFAHIDGGSGFTEEQSRWSIAEKIAKEYETAMAHLAHAIAHGKDLATIEAAQKQREEVERKAEELQKRRRLEAMSKTADEAGVVGQVAGSTLSANAVVAQRQTTDATATAAPALQQVDGGDTELTSLGTKTAAKLDADYFLKVLADNLQMNSKLKVTMFDFGGQEVFNVVHQFFLTQYGVYVVCFNMEEWYRDKAQCQADIRMWVNSVVTHTAKAVDGFVRTAPIFIVGTHKDLVGDRAQHEEISAGILSIFGPNHPATANINENEKENLCFFPVNNKLGRADATMKHMMDLVEACIDGEEYVRMKKPLSWFQVLDTINDAARSFLTYDEVSGLAGDSGVDTATPAAVDDMLAMFHEYGALMWHGEESLRGFVIRDPVKFFVVPATIIICQHTGTARDSTEHEELIHKKMKKQFPSDFSRMTGTGVLTKRLLHGLLSEYEANGQRQIVVRLMMKYGMLVPLRREEKAVAVQEEEDQLYLVPALLPCAPPQSDGAAHTFFFFFSTERLEDRVVRRNDLRNKGFLPSALFVRLIGKVLAWSHDTSLQSTTCHKNWMRVYFGNQLFQLTHHADDNLIQVDIVHEGTPLAVHMRLKSILEGLIAECFKCLHMRTMLAYGGAEPTQGPLRASTPSGLRPIFIPLDVLRDAVEKRNPVVGPNDFKLLWSEVNDRYPEWVALATDVKHTDAFLSYRWNDHDSPFNAKFIDHLTQYAVGETNPRAITTFWDVRSLEFGKNFQDEFVSSLVLSKVVMPLVSHLALKKMTKHEAGSVDNLMIEWLCSLYLLRKGKIYVIPIMIGKRKELEIYDLGGNFFDKDPAVDNTTIMEQLADNISADATVAAAVNLLTKAGAWTAGEPIQPASFGLPSFSPRAIVAAIIACKGYLAWEFDSLLSLFCACAESVRSIVESGKLSDEATAKMSNLKEEALTGETQSQPPAGGTTSSTAAGVSTGPTADVGVPMRDYAKAWEVLHEDGRAEKRDELHALLKELGIIKGDDLEVQDDDDIQRIRSFLNKTGLKLFDRAMGLSLTR